MAGRRSKLELYIDTIEALSASGPTSISRLTLRTKINSNPLKDILHYLLVKNLIEQRKVKKSILYAATPKAKIVLSQFNQLNQIIPFS
jgi:predicted transcriptional regulator